MISVNEFKNGLTILVDGEIWRVVEFQHVKPGKGSAFVRSKLKNLRSGAVQEKTFRAGEKVERAQIDNKKMQYLYADGTNHVFMDMETYEQLELPEERVKNELNYLKENMVVSIIMFGSETLELICQIQLILRSQLQSLESRVIQLQVVQSQLRLKLG